MSDAQNSDAASLAREWIEVWNSGDPTTLPLADDFVHSSPFGRLEGRNHYLDVVRPMAASNVVSLHIQDVVAQGDRACIAFTMDTPNGPVPCCDWIRVAGGRIHSVTSYYDSRSIPNFEKY
ncbi:MAG: nuclear transport factor 2 family protein [Phycisphaeraceae bacterium]|nr:nuclear transport factor 2 family protein [Phycisphaeraceae bacterium]